MNWLGNEPEMEIPTWDLVWNQNWKWRETIHTHTHKIKHSTSIKNIDELIMVVMKEKWNFIGKNDDEEITHVLNLLPSQSKF